MVGKVIARIAILGLITCVGYLLYWGIYIMVEIYGR